MKETKIAKENVKKYEIGIMGFTQGSKTHKQTCQRWLEFLEYFKGWNDLERNSINITFQEKFNDLNRTIKIYNEVGI